MRNLLYTYLSGAAGMVIAYFMLGIFDPSYVIGFVTGAAILAFTIRTELFGP
jgi:uncharacterized membrane protein YjjB (DUF3815 family)